AWRVVAAGDVVGRARGRALLPAPWRRAADHPAPDRPAALDLLVALPVAEDVVAHPSLVAGAGVRAVRHAVPAVLRAEMRAAGAPARGAAGLTVDVVARGPSAQAGAVGLPPAGGEAARRA